MKRYVSLDEISDGRLYDRNDMVKADCRDCEGCSACCRGMGTSIVLDPFDVWRMTTGLNRTFEELLTGGLELNVADGLILPNLAMSGQTKRCFFLTEEGRCGIHPFRPGICRMFPLGRYYENHSFRYFLQTQECKKEDRSKVKVRKWIDTPDMGQYEQYIIDWHYYIKDIQEKAGSAGDEAVLKTVCMSVLKIFYLTPYGSTQDFYTQFYERLNYSL